MGNNINLPENPPAFPTIWDTTHNPNWQTENGMTLRDYFAAQWLASWKDRLFNTGSRENRGLVKMWQHRYGNVTTEQCMVLEAYHHADLMLWARKQNLQANPIDPNDIVAFNPEP